MEEDEEAKMRVLRLHGIVENKEKKVRRLLTLSANSIHRCTKKGEIQKVTSFDSG